MRCVFSGSCRAVACVLGAEGIRKSLELYSPHAAVICVRTRVIPSELADVRIRLLDGPVTAHLFRYVEVSRIDAESRDSPVAARVDRGIAFVCDAHAFRNARKLYPLRHAVEHEAAVVIPGGIAHVVIGLADAPVDLHRLRSPEVYI